MELKLSGFSFLVLFVVKHNSQVVTLIVSQVPIPAGAVLFTAILPLLARVVLLALVGTHRWKTRTHYHYCTSQHCGTPDPCTYTPLGEETHAIITTTLIIIIAFLNTVVLLTLIGYTPLQVETGVHHHHNHSTSRPCSIFLTLVGTHRYVRHVSSSSSSSPLSHPYHSTSHPCGTPSLCR